MPLGVIIVIEGVFVFIIGTSFLWMSSPLFGMRPARSLALLLWHLIFGIGFSIFGLLIGGDAVFYFEESLLNSAQINPGTPFVVFFTSLFSSVFGLSFFATSLIFSMFGALGLLAFDAALSRSAQGRSRHVRLIASVLPFLPSLSFWTSGIGKDSLTFLGLGLALFAIQRISKRWLVFAFAVTLIFMVRPHIGALLLAGFGAGIVFTSRLSKGLKLFFLAAAAGVSLVALPIAANYVGLGGNVSVSDLVSYVEARQQQNLGGGSSVDITSMNWFERMFSYAFRPLFFDANNALALIASIENAFLLAIFCAGGWSIMRRRSFGMLRENNAIMLLTYSLLTIFVLSQTTANLGIASRQKWMFMPSALLFLIGAAGERRNASSSAAGRAARRVKVAIAGT
jgi:hypothetical protein